MKSGLRSQKRRTCNFTRDEIVDHRTGLKLHGIKRVLDGNLGELIEAAQSQDAEEEAWTALRANAPAQEGG